jgi:cytochrome b pre-mRNA-processing protein 3
MLRFLFPRLTADRPHGAELITRISAEARSAHWYVEGAVPDTIDGRFAMLATVTALILVRLERDGGEGDRLSVALTERFIDLMEAEHRQLGLGDPALGRTVRKLVGALARRVDLWRSAIDGNPPWDDAVRESGYKADPPRIGLKHSAGRLRRLWGGLDEVTLSALAEGRLE